MSPDSSAERAARGAGARLARAFELGRVLRRYGFAWFLHESGVGHWVPHRRQHPAPELGLTAPVAFRRALEELGPAAVKLGQALSTRADVLPPDWVTELRGLQDSVAPIPFDQVRQVVEEELGRPLEDLFAQFEEAPAGSASIAQVHFAVLPSGEEVAVKVQRPGIGPMLEGDLALLTQLARLAEARIAWCARNRVSDFVDELAYSLRGELDFALEARNTELIRASLADNPQASGPRVFDGLSAPRVLTTERIRGRKPAELARVEGDGLDRPAIAGAIATLVLRQMLREGAFHTDPHGGNLLVGDDGVVYLLDCGNIAFLPPQIRDDLVHLMYALLEGDAEELVAQLTSIGFSSEQTDLNALRGDVSRYLVHFHTLSTSDVGVGQMLEELLFLIYRHHITMPPVFAQMLRALILVDGECRALDPRFDFRGVARGIVKESLWRTTRPREIARGAYRLVRSLHQASVTLPHQLSSVLRRLDAGGVKLRVEYDDLDRPMHRLDTMFNRLAFSIVIAAMIVAPALWMQVNVQAARPIWHPAHLLLGAGLALGAWLLYSIIRSGRL